MRSCFVEVSCPVSEHGTRPCRDPEHGFVQKLVDGGLGNGTIYDNSSNDVLFGGDGDDRWQLHVYDDIRRWFAGLY